VDECFSDAKRSRESKEKCGRAISAAWNPTRGREEVDDLRNDDREARQALMRRGLAFHPAADLCQMQQQRKGEGCAVATTLRT